MIGKSLKITPVMQKLDSKKEFTTYVPPNTRFVDIIDWKTILDGGSSGGYKSVKPNWDFPIIHMREGRIVPYQVFNESMTTDQLVSAHGINLLIFPDSNANAEGTVFIDSDGVSEDQIYDETYQYYKMTYNDRKIRFVLTHGYDAGGKFDANQLVNNITILNAKQYADTDFACKFNEKMKYSMIKFYYNSTLETLNLYALEGGEALELRTMKGIQFGNEKTDQNLCGVKYIVENVKKELEGPNYGKTIHVDLGPNHPGLNSLSVNFTLVKNNLINVDFVAKVSQEDKPFEIPDIVLNKTIYPINQIYATDDIGFYVEIAKPGEEFYFNIHTKNNPQDIIFSTKGKQFVHTKYYKSMSSELYTDGKIFGLGERVGEFWLGAGSYTIWNRGPASQIEENGEPPGKSLYGSHPVLFVQRKQSGQFFAIYDHNTGPQDYVFELTKNGFEMTNIKTTGRTNLFFLLNDSLKAVTQNYYELVGKPVLPPEWAFGWHQSRFGYNSTQALRDIVAGYKKLNIPLDAIWSDVDYLDDFKDFTIDDENYKDIGSFVTELHQEKMHWVPIIGSGISAGDSDAYFEGLKAGVFIRAHNETKAPLIGRNTPGDVVFVDFFDNLSENYWVEQFKKLFSKAAFDGVWLDMNEITNYCEGV